MPSNEHDEDWRELDRVVARLAENWENVQVFVNRTRGGILQCRECGQGNIYAREGQARALVTMQDERNREYIRKADEEEDMEDSQE